MRSNWQTDELGRADGLFGGWGRTERLDSTEGGANAISDTPPPAQIGGEFAQLSPSTSLPLNLFSPPPPIDCFCYCFFTLLGQLVSLIWAFPFFVSSAVKMAMRRSRSADLSMISREKYLSRWSRENTPMDCVDRWCNNVRRSFTPVRDISGYENIRNERRSRSVDSYRSPLGIVTVPYHTNVNYYQENQPVRKYDVFQARTWSYPIYKYIYGRDNHYSRPGSYTRVYGQQSLYTPSVMAPEAKLATERRTYAGYNYVAGEHSFNLSTKPWSQSNYRFLRVSHISSVPWYFHGQTSNVRHFNSYRPPAFTPRLSTYWKSYF